MERTDVVQLVYVLTCRVQLMAILYLIEMMCYTFIETSCRRDCQSIIHMDQVNLVPKHLQISFSTAAQ